MKAPTIFLISAVALLLLLGGCGCSSYNSLISFDETIKEKWGNLQSDYQRRADLIPNLIKTVKGAKDFEKETLTQVVEARAKATSVRIDASALTPENIKRYQQAQSAISTTLGRLLAVSERYPVLQANANFRDLQAQLEGTENRIKVARNDFNNAVKKYNRKARSFPSNIIARWFNFEYPKGYFEAKAGSEEVPEVDFGN